MGGGLLTNESREREVILSISEGLLLFPWFNLNLEFNKSWNTWYAPLNLNALLQFDDLCHVEIRLQSKENPVW